MKTKWIGIFYRLLPKLHVCVQVQSRSLYSFLFLLIILDHTFFQLRIAPSPVWMVTVCLSAVVYIQYSDMDLIWISVSIQQLEQLILQNTIVVIDSFMKCDVMRSKIVFTLSSAEIRFLGIFFLLEPGFSRFNKICYNLQISTWLATL
mgnify:CR=1 FL=1